MFGFLLAHCDGQLGEIIFSVIVSIFRTNSVRTAYKYTIKLFRVLVNSYFTLWETQQRMKQRKTM